MSRRGTACLDRACVAATVAATQTSCELAKFAAQLHEGPYVVCITKPVVVDYVGADRTKYGYPLWRVIVHTVHLFKRWRWFDAMSYRPELPFVSVLGSP